MNELQKVDYDEYVRTTEMFYVNKDIEIEIDREVTASVESLCHRMKEINSIDGLK